MSFQPVIPLSGYAGWRFLSRTMDTQKAAFVESAPFKRNTDHFRDKIATVRTADDLLADRQLLQVALGAFGLDDDIGNTAFIRRILEDGTISDDALANKLSDKRYAAFSLAFGFGDLGARTGLAIFPDEILKRYEARQFEKAVGEQDDTMRLALNLRDGLSDIIRENGSDRAQWYSIMGNPPLRSVIEGALGFPKTFARIDIDQQLVAFRERSKATFGTDHVADLAAPENREKLIRLFMIRTDAAANVGTSSASIALNLLQGIARR